MTNLEDRYNNLFGTKTSKGQLYGGFFLLIAGVVLGIAALILFFISYNVGGNDQFTWKRGALPLGSFALAAIFFGASVTLPTKTGMRIVSYIGAGLCLLASVLLFIHYPDNVFLRNPAPGQENYTALDVIIYAAGFAAILASLFTSLIGYYLGRLQPTAVASGEDEVDDETYGPGYEVPDWVVERDIEYAMKKYGVSWGDGKGSGTSNLNVNVADAVGGKFVVGGLGKAKTVQLDAEQVDAGVKGLTTIRPSKKPSLPGEWADDSVSALKGLRRQQAGAAGSASAAAVTPKAARKGFWARFWDALTGRNKSGAAAKNGAPAKLGSANLNPVEPPANAPRKGKQVVIPDEK